MSTYPATADLPGNTPNFRYLLDEASGNALAETGGQDLTDTNTVGAGTGYSDLGATFDNARDFEQGNTEYFTKADNAVFDITGDVTFSVLVNPESTGTNRGILSKWGSSGVRAYQIFIQDNEKVTLQSTSDGTSGTEDNVPSTTSISASVWTHIVIVKEASTRQTNYLDGSEDNESTSGINSSIYNSSQPFQIGALNGGSTFDGLMNDVIGWADALTDAEVLQLYELYTTAAAGASGTIFKFLQIAGMAGAIEQAARGLFMQKRSGLWVPGWRLGMANMDTVRGNIEESLWEAKRAGMPVLAPC